MNEFSSISFVLLLTYVFAAQQPPLPKSSPQHNEPVPKEVVESRDNSFEVKTLTFNFVNSIRSKRSTTSYSLG